MFPLFTQWGWHLYFLRNAWNTCGNNMTFPSAGLCFSANYQILAHANILNKDGEHGKKLYLLNITKLERVTMSMFMHQKHQTDQWQVHSCISVNLFYLLVSQQVNNNTLPIYSALLHDNHLWVVLKSERVPPSSSFLTDPAFPSYWDHSFKWFVFEGKITLQCVKGELW